MKDGFRFCGPAVSINRPTCPGRHLPVPRLQGVGGGVCGGVMMGVGWCGGWVGGDGGGVGVGRGSWRLFLLTEEPKREQKGKNLQRKEWGQLQLPSQPDLPLHLE